VWLFIWMVIGSKKSYHLTTYTPVMLKHAIIMRFCIVNDKSHQNMGVLFYMLLLSMFEHYNKDITVTNLTTQRLDINRALDILRWDIPLFRCMDDYYVSLLYYLFWSFHLLFLYLLIWIWFPFLMVANFKDWQENMQNCFWLHGSRPCIKD